MANLLYGTFSYTLDAKGRVRIPPKLRESISQPPSDPLMITKGLDKCLFLYPTEQWNRIVAKLDVVSFTKSNSRMFEREFFGGAEECPIDGAGRVALPQRFREYAGIQREVIIMGVRDRIEIWSKELRERSQEESDKSYEQVAEQLF